MKTKKFLGGINSICLSVFVALLLLTIAFPPPVLAAEKVEIEIYSNPLGSTGYAMSFGLAQLINKYSTKYHATAVETKSASVNMLHLIQNPDARKNTIGYGNPQNFDHAKLGKPPFDKPQYDFRWLSMVGTVIQFFVSTTPKVTTIEHMAGKRIALGPKGHSMEFIPRLVLQHGNGIYDKMKVSNLTFEGIKNALLDGTVDCGVVSAIRFGPGGDWKGNPATDEVLTTKKCYLLTQTEEALKKAREKGRYSIYPGTLGPREYGKTTVTEPIIGMALTLAWFAHKSMPDEYVRDILEIIYEHSGEFVQFHATGKGLTKKTMADVTAPKEEFHPAAIKFYEERGFKVGR